MAQQQEAIRNLRQQLTTAAANTLNNALNGGTYCATTLTCASSTAIRQTNQTMLRALHRLRQQRDRVTSQFLKRKRTLWQRLFSTKHRSHSCSANSQNEKRPVMPLTQKPYAGNVTWRKTR